MAHVAKEMKREGFEIPLLIGGATTSRAHTSVKIAPGYDQAVVHVLDASRAVGVVSSLLNPALKPAFIEKNRVDQDKLRRDHLAQRDTKPLLTIAEARERRTPIVWKAEDIAKPAFIGFKVLSSTAGTARSLAKAASSNGGERGENRVRPHPGPRPQEREEDASVAGEIPLTQALSANGGEGEAKDRIPLIPSFSPSGGEGALRADEEVSLEELVPYIDWSPFFHTWELRGRYPGILDDPKAKELFDDAQRLLKRIVKEKLLTARAVYGFFPANSVGDDIQLYTDESRTKVLTTFHTLRQQMNKPAGQFNHALGDFIAPKSTGLPDYLGAFAVTTGHGADELAKHFEQDHDDYNSIMTKALADRLAEAFAEYLHKRARDDWGFGRTENLSVDDLIHEKYRGIRPAAGYPACPDHTEKGTLWQVLDVENKTGIKLTESYAMWPASSVSGLYFAHPEAKYFGVGKIDRNQALDYHLRKGMDLQTVERWLAPNLNYDPEESVAAADSSAAVAGCSCGVPHGM
jgi:5-methyltetrahydrofolate--homocysteine methyltransferase